MSPWERYVALHLCAAAVLIVCGAPPAQAGWLSDTVSRATKAATASDGTPGDAQVASGLKEALKIGVEHAVQSGSRPNGYFANPAIKILMPEQLRGLEAGLRKVGLGSQVDQFTLSMNRAAEQAAPYAKDIFLEALLGMNFEDARQILQGGETAATDYFKRTTRTRLESVFLPIVKDKMAQHAVAGKYDQMVAAYKALPFAGKPTLISIDQYVVNKALDGLFQLVSEQEKSIRTNPQARVTDLLKRVFTSP